MHCENCGSTRIDCLDVTFSINNGEYPPNDKETVLHIRCYDCNFEWVE